MSIINKKTKIHLLFEQSGTFRDAFRAYGHDSYCYDLNNDYGTTDCQIDLFLEIENEYNNVWNSILNSNTKTIFNKMTPENDFIMAFFPCTYFSDLNELCFTLQQKQLIQNKENNNMKQPLKNIELLFDRINSRAYMFQLFIKLCYICEHLNLRIIIENPVGMYNRNYLTLYSPYRPSFIDKDRSEFGDNFKKPTVFFAINFEMVETFKGFYYDKKYFTKNICAVTNKNERSEITQLYAKNFYERFLQYKLL